MLGARLCLLGVLAASGCAFLEEKVNDEIRERVPGGTVPGEPVDPGPVIDEERIEVNSVQPNRGLTTGDTVIEILGVNFVEGARVMVGSTLASGVTFVSENRIQCVTPPRDTPGVVGVRVIDPANGSFDTLEGGFEYYEAVTVVALSPERGPTSGGTDVTITGTGFIDGTRVEFGGGELLDPVIIDSEHLVVTTPELPRDVHTVTVANVNGEFSLQGAFTTYDALRIDRVSPLAGPLGGGTTLTLEGAGFVTPTTLTVGGQSVAGTSGVGELLLTGVTAAMPSGSAEGPVDVVATNGNGAVTRPDAFVFYDAQDPTPRVLAVMPAAAPIAGGTPIDLVGAGFTSGTVSVEVGGAPATCTVFDDHLIGCSAPAGAEGVTSLSVTIGTTVLVRTFEYVDLRVVLADPQEGAIAGRTYVQLFGNGFAADAQVFFDGRPATDVVAVSGTELTLRTPPGTLGAADIEVVTRGLQAAGTSLYTYVDPADYTHWTSGGPIDGTVNVTVLDGDTNQPLRGALVVLGAELDPTQPHRYGFTDVRGQLTLSGPDIVGPQSVHAFKDAFGAFSWLETDAQNLTLALPADPGPAPDPIPPCPPPPQESGLPPLVRGKVTRIKDQWNTGNDTVLVTTTYVTFSVPLPDPGPKAQLVNNGDYEAFVRTGDLVVLALAGSVSGNGTFNTIAMGFHPFVYTEPSSGAVCEIDATCDLGEQCWRAEPTAEEGLCIRIYEGIDIVVDTPLSQFLTIQFDSPPLGITGSYPNWAKPTNAYAFVWYDFGSMGLWPMGSAQGTSSVIGLAMPRQLPESLGGTPYHVVGEVYGSGFFGDQTWSTVYRQYNYTTRDPVVLTPTLRALREITPGFAESPAVPGNASAPMHFELEQLPDNSMPDPSGMVHYIYDIVDIPICEHPVMGVITDSQARFQWMAMSPGDLGAFDLPRLTAPHHGLNAPNGFYNWQLNGLYAPAATYEHLDLNALYDYTSYTGRVTAIEMP